MNENTKGSSIFTVPYNTQIPKFHILHNRIKCRICGDIIESTTVHDFKMCSCGACGVDGGHDYLRRIGDMNNWQEISETTMQLPEKK